MQNVVAIDSNQSSKSLKLLSLSTAMLNAVNNKQKHGNNQKNNCKTPLLDDHAKRDQQMINNTRNINHCLRFVTTQIYIYIYQAYN